MELKGFRRVAGFTSSSTKIISVIVGVNSFVALIFYPLIPFIFNYAPSVISLRKDKEWLGFSYTTQFITIVVIAQLIEIVYLVLRLRRLRKWRETLESGDSNSIKSLRNECLRLPYLIYSVQIFVPIAIIVILHLFLRTDLFIVVKTCITVFTFTTLSAVIPHIYIKNTFKRILIEAHSELLDSVNRIGLLNKIFLQVIPLFVVSILFTSLLGYSVLIRDKGDNLFKFYKSELNSLISNKNLSLTDMQNVLSKYQESNSVTCFILKPDNSAWTSDESTLGSLFIKYVRELSPIHSGRVYDNLAGEVQGVIIKHDNLIIGFKYSVASWYLIICFLVSFVVLMLLCIIVLYYFSSSLAKDIDSVANSLSSIAKGEIRDLDKKLAVTSNDEIGDLVVSLNKIIDLERVNKENEKLIGMGYLVAGVAHNFKTAIASTKGMLDYVSDYIDEYDSAVKSDNSTEHIGIIGNMRSYLGRANNQLVYMNNVITDIKKHVDQLNDVSNDTSEFTIKELVEQVESVASFQVKKNNCTFLKVIEVEDTIKIAGSLVSLVQVIENLIVNGIHSYADTYKQGIIEFGARENDSLILVYIKDYGCGIPDKIKTRLFKQMTTTKGKLGSGLGLYMSYSTIKGRFNGSMWFDSEEGVGTTFYVSVPKSRRR